MEVHFLLLKPNKLSASEQVKPLKNSCRRVFSFPAPREGLGDYTIGIKLHNPQGVPQAFFAGWVNEALNFRSY